MRTISPCKGTHFLYMCKCFFNFFVQKCFAADRNGYVSALWDAQKCHFESQHQEGQNDAPVP